MSKICIIFNSSSGGESQKSAISKLLELPENSMFSLVDFDSRNIQGLISKLADGGCTDIVAAGGDGTVSCIVGAIMEEARKGRSLRLGVLPFGTFNHFAKDLGIPFGIEEALDTIKKGQTRRVDIGQVNDTYFLNNSSLGLYPKIIKIRDQIQKKGFMKTIAFFAACLFVFFADNSLSIDFESENKKIHKTTPFVFIGNNKYEISGFNIGERRKLDEGTLSICISKELTKRGLVVLLFKAMINRLMEATDFNVIGLKEFTINSRASFIDVSHDGEVSKMSPPLHYQIISQALSVIIP